MQKKKVPHTQGEAEKYRPPILQYGEPSHGQGGGQQNQASLFAFVIL